MNRAAFIKRSGLALRALAVIIAMLAGFAPLSASAADHKIVVIADPHVMAPELLTNAENADWTTYLDVSRRLTDYSQALFDQVLTDISEMTTKPELVLIVGDLTKDGEQVSHAYVKGKLDGLGITTLVIPGNHDMGTVDAKAYGETTTDVATISKDDFATIYADYGYGASSRCEETTLTYACEPMEGLVVIGIDSGTDGILSETTLKWVCDEAKAARAAGKQVIAMMHHPLMPHITGGDVFVSTVSVDDYENVRNSLADAGISTVFTGHFHTSDIAKDWNGDMSKTIYDVTTGSLCSYPCDYRVVTLSVAMTSMSIATESIASTAGTSVTGEAFSTAIAKSRLESSVKSVMSQKIKAKLVESGQNEIIASVAADFIASEVADAYIYHAEGNENENEDAQESLASLDGWLQNYPEYKNMVNSMLQDKSNYGDALREDQTNDRTLSVGVPGDANGDKVVNVVDIVKLVKDHAPQTDIDEVLKIIFVQK